MTNPSPEDLIMLSVIHQELSKGKSIHICPIITEHGYAPLITNSYTESLDIDEKNLRKLSLMRQTEELLKSVEVSNDNQVKN